MSILLLFVIVFGLCAVAYVAFDGITGRNPANSRNGSIVFVRGHVPAKYFIAAYNDHIYPYNADQEHKYVAYKRVAKILNITLIKQIDWHYSFDLAKERLDRYVQARSAKKKIINVTIPVVWSGDSVDDADTE